MNQHTSIIEHNGMMVIIKNTNECINWFIAKGVCLYPDMNVEYISTLGRVWNNETKMNVKYDVSERNREIIQRICNNMYETKVT